MENRQKELKFPDGFLWGTSTSAYQVEGGITNDWSEWEATRVNSKKFKNKVHPKGALQEIPLGCISCGAPSG